MSRRVYSSNLRIRSVVPSFRSPRCSVATRAIEIAPADWPAFRTAADAAVANGDPVVLTVFRRRVRDHRGTITAKREVV